MSITSINTWQSSFNYNGVSHRLSTSQDGQYILVVVSWRQWHLDSENLVTYEGKVLYSNDSGATFQDYKTKFGSFDLSTISGTYYTKLPSGCRVSKSGQYQVVFINNQSINYKANIFVSDDYGANFTLLAENQQHSSRATSNFAMSEPVSGITGNFPCYISFVVDNGSIWVYNPNTNTFSQTAGYQYMLSNDIDMSDDGSTIIISRRNQGSLFSTDFGATFSVIPNLTQYGGACAISDNGNQMILVDFNEAGSASRKVIYTTDKGQNWVQNTITTNSHIFDIDMSASKIVMVGSNGLVLSSTDGQTFTEEALGTTGSLFAITHFDTDKFYFVSTPPATDTTMTLYVLDYGSGGGSSQEQSSSTPTIYYNTSPIVERYSASITSASSLSFTLPLPTDYKHYKATLLHETSINSNPVFVGDIFFNSSEKVVIPLVSQKILSQSFSDNVLSFVLDANYSGTFTLSIMRSS